MKKALRKTVFWAHRRWSLLTLREELPRLGRIQQNVGPMLEKQAVTVSVPAQKPETLVGPHQGPGFLPGLSSNPLDTMFCVF